MNRYNTVKICCPQLNFPQITTGSPNNPLIDIYWVTTHQLCHCSADDISLQEDPGSTNLLSRTCLLGLGSRDQGVTHSQRPCSHPITFSLTFKLNFVSCPLQVCPLQVCPLHVCLFKFVFSKFVFS